MNFNPGEKLFLVDNTNQIQNVTFVETNRYGEHCVRLPDGFETWVSDMQLCRTERGARLTVSARLGAFQ